LLRWPTKEFKNAKFRVISDMEDLQTGWNIREITFYPEYSGYTNFVNTVDWSCDAKYTGTSVESFHVSSNGRSFFDTGTGSFIAYDDLTEQDVLGWVFDQMTSGHKESIEQDVYNRALENINAKTTGVFPWS